MASIVLKSPSRISYDELPKFLVVREATASLTDCQIECDCRELTFLDPLGLCVLKHWFVELEERGVKLHLKKLRLATESFLRRMDLFKDAAHVTFEDHTSSYKRRDMTGQLIELQSLKDIRQIGKTATQIAETIVHGIPNVDFKPDPDQMRPSVGERMEDVLQYIFSEILLNALDHGRKRNYSHAHAIIAAQYYPALNKLEVAILDNGCGLLETLQAHPLMEGEVTDSKAISIAYQPRVSCNRDAELGLDTRNQGIGLTVSARIALAAQGRCGIFSGNSRHSLLPGGNVECIEMPYWRGTGVFFQFDKAALLGVNKGEIIQALPNYRNVNKINFG